LVSHPGANYHSAIGAADAAKESHAMSRLSVLANDELAPELAGQAQSADRAGQNSTVLRVLGHRPDMLATYLKFYYQLHNGGVVDVALKELVRLRIAELNQCLT
jgi:alkylhydroperoxidase family enzyme